MGNTLLIDGTNLSIIHFTANPAVDDNGVPVGMVKGFLNSIVWLNRTLKPEKIIIFFDGQGGSSQRRSLYSEYKEGRKKNKVVGRYYKFSDEDKAEKNKEYQLSLLKSILENLPVNVITSSGFEADDGIAYCVKHKKYFNFDHVYIVSCDKDFYQLIADDIHIYNPMSKKIINEKSVVEEFGIHPVNWLFYRAISGDKSDNVPGVKGIGPKTLLKIFNLIGEDTKHTIEDLNECYLVKDEIEDESKKKKIIQLYENKETIERNWKLLGLADPMLSNSHCDRLTQEINQFAPSYKKIDTFRDVSRLGLNASSFDELRFLVKRGN